MKNCPKCNDLDTSYGDEEPQLCGACRNQEELIEKGMIAVADSGNSLDEQCEHDFTHEKKISTGFFGRYKEEVIIYCKKCGEKHYE